jgi:formate hydrogenlyase subunit 4
MSWIHLVLGAAAVVVAPFVGGLLGGLDRKVTARLQGRRGPPITQPFYDFLKLWGKERIVAGRFQNAFPWVYLLSVVTSLVLIALGQDLLVMLFVLALGSSALIVGGFAVKSPYSQLGSQRELLQLLAYEPVLILMAVAIFFVSGSFEVSKIVEAPEPLLFSLPLVALAMLPVIGIKLRKSPFDISTSHHAHQETVRGVLTEFSGRQLALIELTHWYEAVLLVALVGLFWAQNPLAASLLGSAFFYAAVLWDNVAARMTWSWMLKFTWAFGVGLAVVNLAWLWVRAR